MGLIKDIKETISPTPTEEQLREKEIMKRFGLKRDPVVPHRYWIDDRKAINFNPGSEASCVKAVAKLEEMFDNPTIEEMPEDSRERGPFGPKGSAKKEGFLAHLEPAIRSASEGTDKQFREEFGGFNPKEIEKEMMSTKGVHYDPVGVDDFFGDLGKKKKGGKR